MISRRLAARGAGVALAFLSAVAIPASSQQPTGKPARLAIPAYLGSDDLRSWEAIASRAKAVALVVVNPRSGPFVVSGPRCANRPVPDLGVQTGPNLTGLRKDDSHAPALIRDDPKLVIGSSTYLPTLEEQFVRRTRLLESVGIAVYGYVWANANGADPSCVRDAAVIGDEISAYRRIYGIRNIFFDDSSPSCTDAAQAARASMASLVRAGGGSVALNIGEIAGGCAARDADVIVNFEQSASRYADAAMVRELERNSAELRANNPSVRIWHLVHSASAADLVSIAAQASALADLAYITDDGPAPRGCDTRTSPWDSLFGTWPLVRDGAASCEARENGAGHSWPDVVRALTGDDGVASLAGAPTTTAAAPSPTSAAAVTAGPPTVAVNTLLPAKSVPTKVVATTPVATKAVARKAVPSKVARKTVGGQGGKAGKGR